MKPQNREDHEEVKNNMDFGREQMYLKELGGEGHILSSLTGSNFDHYRGLHGDTCHFS